MRRVLSGLAVLLTLAFGLSENSLAVNVNLVDGTSLSSIFTDNLVLGHELSGADMVDMGYNEYELLLFSAYSDGRSTVHYGPETLVSTNNSLEGYIGGNYGPAVLGDVFITSGGKPDIYSLYDPDSFGAGKRLQAFMLDRDTTVNDMLYGKGSIFVGFEDGKDFDYNDVVLAFRAAPSAVPVPAAGWLLGSGLLGLVALRRKGAKA